MKSPEFGLLLLLLVRGVHGGCTNPIWAQCGGTTWKGATCCMGVCNCTGTDAYKQCTPPKGGWQCGTSPHPSPSPPSPPGPSPGPSPPGPSPGVKDALFVLDLFVNDPGKGWQPTGFPEYLQKSAANYTNMAGISFIQPNDLMDASYDLPTQVGNAVRLLRKQGVGVQLLVGGEIANGWGQLEANPTQAATNAIQLMQKYDCGIEVDNEAGGAAAGVVKFIQLCAKGKPNGTFISMDVAGTPNGVQKATIQGAIGSLDWVNMMVSAPSYDQGLSIKYGHADGIPFNKLTVAYYAGTWVNNCNTVGSGPGSTGAGIKLFKQFGLRGLSIWAVGGASYSNCKTTDAPGFSQAMIQLGAHPV